LYPVINIYQIHTPEPSHIPGYNLTIDLSLYKLTQTQPEHTNQKAKTTVPFVSQHDDDEPPPVTSVVTHQEQIFTQPAATTTTILSQPRKSRRASQAEREQFVKTKLPLDLQKALNEPFGKENIRQSFFSEVKLRHVLVFVFDFIDLRTRQNLKLLSKDAMLLDKILTDYNNIDPTPFRGFQPNWKDQSGIPKERTQQFTAAMVQHKFDTAKLVRWIGGPHTADHRNTKKIIETIAKSVDQQTLTHLARIFTSGSPTICQATETDVNLQSYIDYNNHRTIEKNWEKMYKTVSKDVRNGYVLHFHKDVHRFI
jgi:hypothetical protein